MQETVTPRRAIRSDGLLFVLVLAATVALSYAMGLLAALLPQAALWIRIAVYVLLVAGVYWLIRKRMTSYRYVAGDTCFAVYRAVGKKEACVERVPWEEALWLRPYGAASGEKGREFLLSARRKRASMVLAHRQRGVLNHLIISPGEAMCEAIRARVAAAGQTEEEA